jgi:hypothetical protein
MTTSKLYYAPETTISFKSSGGDAVFSPASISSGGGRVSAVYDRGSGSKPAPFRWQARTRANVGPTVGGVVRIYLITGQDGTYEDAAFAAGDAAVSSEDSFRNATLIGQVQADANSTTKDFVKSGLVYIYGRYIRVGWWNALSQALHATAANHEMTLTPVPDEAQ